MRGQSTSWRGGAAQSAALQRKPSACPSNGNPPHSVQYRASGVVTLLSCLMRLRLHSTTLRRTLSDVCRSPRVTMRRARQPSLRRSSIARRALIACWLGITQGNEKSRSLRQLPTHFFARRALRDPPQAQERAGARQEDAVIAKEVCGEDQSGQQAACYCAPAAWRGAQRGSAHVAP